MNKTMEQLTEKQALELIEYLCLQMNGDETNELGNIIYTIVHPFGSCGNKHVNWVKDGVQMYNEMEY